jgi:GNAT superfamily N-acetyltransferase
MTFELRPAVSDDTEAIARLWHRAWRDGHAGHVPDALYPHRQLEHFLARVPPRIPQTTVAMVGPDLAGFVTLHQDEVEQIYVAESARGSGVAAALLQHAERELAGRFDRIWLAVVEGNARARSFLYPPGMDRRGLSRLRRRDRRQDPSRSLPPLRKAARASPAARDRALSIMTCCSLKVRAWHGLLSLGTS